MILTLPPGNFIMIPGFDKIVEKRIQTARKNGAFDNLAGAGERLKLEDDRHVPEDLRLVYKILKNANCLPPELELKKKIRQAEDLLAGMTDTANQYHALKKINFLIMKLNTMRRGSVQFEIPQRYQADIAKRIEKDP